MKTKPQLLLILTGMIWGSMGILVRVLGGIGLKSLDMIAVRSMIITCIMFVFLMVFRKHELKIRFRDMWCFVGTGVVSVVFYNYCYYEVIKNSSLASATIWLYTAPAFVMILSTVLFKEKLTLIKTISIGLTFVGCVFVSGIGYGSVQVSLSTNTILLGLGSGIGYALYTIFSRYAMDRGYSSVTILFYTFLCVTISTFAIVNVQDVFKTAFNSPYRAMLCLIFSVGGTLIPYLLYMNGMKYVENSRASVLVSVEPITATIIGCIVYRETLSSFVIAGVIMVLLGVIIAAKET